MAHQPPTPGSSSLPNGGYPPPNWPNRATTNGSGSMYPPHPQQQQQHLPPNIPGPYADPTSLLSAYPIGMYMPTARVAGHFAPHTETLQSPSSTSDLYPQYNSAFQTLKAPQNGQEMQMRAEMAVRLAQNLNSSGFSSYGNVSYAQPTTVQRSAVMPSYGTGSSSSYSNPMNGSSSYYQSPSQPQQRPSLQYTQQPPTYRQPASSPHISTHPHYQQASSSASQYQQHQQASSASQYQQHQQPQLSPQLSSASHYQQLSPSLPFQTQQLQQTPYRQPSQSQSPQVQYQQQPQQSLSSPLVQQYTSPPLQNRQVSPAQSQASQSAYRQPSPYQPLQLDLSSTQGQYQASSQLSTPYQASPVVSSSTPQYQAQQQQQQAAAPSSTQYQSTVSSSGQYQQYTSPPSQHHALHSSSQFNFSSSQPQQQHQQQHSATSLYTSPPQVNIPNPTTQQSLPSPQYSHTQYSQPPSTQYLQQQPQQQQQYSQPQQTEQVFPQQTFNERRLSQSQYSQIQQPKIKSPPLPSPALQTLQSPSLSQQSGFPGHEGLGQLLSQPQQVPLPQQPHQPQQLPPQVPQQVSSVQQQPQQPVPQALQPLPYALLPQNPLLNAAQPPTPISLSGSPAPSITNEYFENYISRTLKIHSPSPMPNGLQGPQPVAPPAIHVPPSLPTSVAPSALTLPSAPAQKPPKMPKTKPSPDHLTQPLHGPSPAKKRKSNSSSRQSPAPPSTPQKQKSSSFVIELKTLTPDERQTYRSMTNFTDTNHSTMSMKSTPKDEESEDDLNWNDNSKVEDPDWDMGGNFLRPDYQEPISVTPTSGRTGDKDQRTAFQKLQSLLEDVFEESDAFEASPSLDQVSASKFFDGLSVDGVHPTLSSQTMDKIARRVSRLQDNRKRQRSKANAETIPWDIDNMLRLFRMLEKSMRDAEFVDPFPGTGRKSVVKANPSPKKKKAGRKAAADSAEATPDLEMSTEELFKGEQALGIMKVGAAAALCCLAILDSETMPKQLYSEDLLLLAVKIIRHQMTKILFPVVEGLAGEKLNSRFLAHIVNTEASAAARAKSSRKVTLFDNGDLASLAQSTCGAVPRIANLIARSDMSFSDSLVIETVYLAIGPIFVKEAGARRGRAKTETTGGPTWSVMKSLRTDALGCLRGAFAKYEEQRRWILEEILGSLGKNQEQGTSGQALFQLPDGRSISTLTALLLQLIQASSYGVGSRIRRLRSARMDVEGDSGAQTPDQQTLDGEEMRIMTDAITSGFQSTALISRFLVQKASGNKNTKAAQDTDFKAILDTVVSDLLQVLYRPEWPGTAHFITILLKTLINSLNDTKSTAESNASKNVALDYLGDIGSRIRSLQLEMDSQPIIPSLEDLIAKPNTEGLNKLLDGHLVIQSFLASAARDDSMYKSSDEMNRITWGQELQSALTTASSVLERLSMETEEDGVQDREELYSMTQVIRKVGRDLWSSNGGLFEINAPKRAEDATEASYAISRSRSLQKAFDRILFALISAMDINNVPLRSKALRGLASIVVADPDILSRNDVRSAIDSRLADPSPAVRDAAVELIGKYVVQRAEWVEQYFPIIVNGINDPGLNVRKRVVKLLRDMFAVATSGDARVQICVVLVQAAQDEDDGIKDLAVKSLMEILYPASFDPDKTASLLVDILDQSKGGEDRLEKALEKISKLCNDAGHKDWFAKTIDSLISCLNDDPEQNSSFDAKSYIRAIHILSTENPALIDTQKAKVLLPHLKSQPVDAVELASNELLLKIFTRSIPHLPRAASSFANELTEKIQHLVKAPVTTAALERPIECWSVLAHCITKQFRPMTSLLRSAIVKLPAAKDKQVGVLQYISAVITEYGKLEVAARDDPGVKTALDNTTRGQPLSDFLFSQYLSWSAVESHQKLPITCLGCLFRAYPQLILNPKAEQWMAGIFKSDSPENKAYLLNLLTSFLQSEAERRAKTSSAKDVADLIGSANELHESGISTALVQRSIDYIVEGAKSHHSNLQSAAMTVLEFTINQGLYHPLHLLPLLISLETSDDRKTKDSALKLHETLHNKHSSMLNCRYLEFAQASFDYQKTISSEVSGHRRGRALLAGWWRLLSDKRNIRVEFLKNIVRAFDFELAGRDEIHPAFVLYISENLALLDYKNQEEVMLVVQHLSRLISEGGAAVANAMELGVVEGPGFGLLEGKMAVVSEAEKFSATRLANATIVIALALLTKNLLLDVYSLQEDKCLSWVGGRKSVMGDKAVTRRYPDPIPLDYSRLPVPRGVETVEDYTAQRDSFLQLMKEDGSMGWQAT